MQSLIPLTLQKLCIFLLSLRFLHTSQKPVPYGRRLSLINTSDPWGKLSVAWSIFLSLFFAFFQFGYYPRQCCFQSMTGLDVSDTDLLKIWHALSSTAVSLTGVGMPTTSQQFRRNCWRFSQQCLSFPLIRLTSLSFEFLMMFTSGSNFRLWSNRPLISFVKFIICEFILFSE